MDSINKTPDWVNSGDIKKGDIRTGEELIERMKIGKSPLEIVGNKERGYFVVLGKHRITEPEESMTKVQEYMMEEPIDFMFRLICAVPEIIEKNNTEKIKGE